MVLRWQEAAVCLVVVLGLLVLKHVPVTEGLPLGRTIGVVCFGYAIFLALRLVQGLEAVERDGWHELRASPVELFGALAASALSAMLLGAVLINGQNAAVPFRQLATALALSLGFALIAGAIILACMLARVRWNRSVIEHTNGLGKRTVIVWSDVAAVRVNWRGITISDRAQGQVRFSPYQSGAAELVRLAANRVARNSSTAFKAFAS